MKAEPTKAQMDELIARLRQYRGRGFETTECYNGLRDEAAAAIAERDATIAALRAERDAWRNAMQSWTPGGSEFMTPGACSAFVAMRREDEHRAKADAVRSRREVTRLRAGIRDAVERPERNYRELGDDCWRYPHDRSDLEDCIDCTNAHLAALLDPQAPDAGEGRL